MLSALEIVQLVDRYQRERDRFEKMAAVVSDRLSTELRANAVRHLPTFRAKDATSLQRKLQDMAATKTVADFDPEFAPTIADLAGVRIMLYDRDDESRTCDIIQRVFVLPSDPRCKKDFLTGDGYRALHRIITLPNNVVRQRPEVLGNLAEVWCEIQVVTLADHIWNELEHDIVYKTPDGSASREQTALLGSLRSEVDSVCSTVRRVVDATVHRKAENRAAIETAEDLSAVLSTLAGRRLSGNHSDLLRLLTGTLTEVTPAQLEELPLRRPDLDAAQTRLTNAGLTVGGAGDVGLVVTALWDGLGVDFIEVTGHWPGRRGAMAHLLRRIENAAAAGRI
jgi:ppGpp synthetase/RelA/SpoT-type nucleotidyltranferase